MVAGSPGQVTDARAGAERASGKLHCAMVPNSANHDGWLWHLCIIAR